MKHLHVRWTGLFLLVAAALLSRSLAADAAAGKFTFERDDSLWIANLDGTGAKKIADGQNADLAPDGTKIAYNTVEADGQPPHRKIVILDLATGTSNTLQDIPSDNCDRPVWSPDGKQLLVTYHANDESRIGIINADGTGFHDVSNTCAKPPTYWSTNWAADGQSLFAQDMESVYRLDLDGKVLKKWAIDKLAPNGSMSSDCNLNPSPDGKTLLMDIEMDEDARKGWEGPPPAIWIMDLTTEKCSRLTPPKFYAWTSRWLKAPDSILYVSQKIDEDVSCVYRMSATGNGADSKLILKNASFPSSTR